MTGAPLLLLATITGALAAGMVLGLPQVLQGPLAKRLGKDERWTRGLAVALNLIQIPLLLISGFLIDHWGVQEVVLVGSVLLAVGATLLAESRSLSRAGLGLILLGAGGANLLTGSCVLMTLGAVGNLLPALYWGTVFLTMGIILLPMLATRILRHYGLRQALLGIALATLIPALLATFLPAKVGPPLAPNSERALDSPVLWLTGVTVLFYIFLLVVLAARAKLYLTQAGHRAGLTAVLAGCFWLAFLASRIMGGIIFAEVELIPKDPEPWIIMGLGLALAIDLGNMAGSDNARGAGIGLLFAGVCLGPVLPTALELAFRLFPAERGTAAGVLWSLGMLGWLLATKFPGRPAEPRPEGNLLRAPLVLALLLAITALVLVLVIPLSTLRE